MTRITNKQEYAISMSYDISEPYKDWKAVSIVPTKYNAYDHNTVKPGDICYTCLQELEVGDVFRSLWVSAREIYMEHEWHQPGVGHQQITEHGGRVPFQSGFL